MEFADWLAQVRMDSGFELEDGSGFIELRLGNVKRIQIFLTVYRH